MTEGTGTVYFRDGELIAEAGSARVYKMRVEDKEELFLELGEGHTLWAHTMEWSDYAEQIYDKPRGNCLEIGLGLGVASRYILSCPKVSHLTTVEISKDVIDLQQKLNPISDKWGLLEFKDRHTILNAEGLAYAYMTRDRYDFIFIDCYDRIDEETLPVIADIAYACKRILKSDGKMIGWFDPNTPEEFVNAFFQIFEILS